MDNLPEQRIRVHVLTVPEGEADESSLLRRFSTLHQLIRFTSWCRRWLRILSRNPGIRPLWFDHAVPLVLQTTELAKARILWIRNVQVAGFKKDLEAVGKGIQLPSSKLTNLYPFKDDQGVLRVGGRLKHSSLPSEMKHFIILLNESHFTRLVIAINKPCTAEHNSPFVRFVKGSGCLEAESKSRNESTVVYLVCDGGRHLLNRSWALYHLPEFDLHVDFCTQVWNTPDLFG